MKNKLRTFIAALLLAWLPAAAWAQALPDNPQPARPDAAGWSRVRDLANGEQIDVALGGGQAVPCRFAGATDDSLFCNSLFREREFHFSRAEVERVRMDDRQRNTRIVIATFAAAGLIWGLAAPRPAGDATPRAVVGLAGAAVGGLTGLFVSMPAALLIPGRLVYHRPHAGPKPSPSAPTPSSQPTSPKAAVGTQ